MSNYFSWLAKFFKRICRYCNYILLAVIVAGFIFILTIWLRERQLLIYIWQSDLFSWPAKFKFFLDSGAAGKTLFNPVDQVVLILVSILSGVNLSLLVFYLRSRSKILKLGGLSGFGLITAWLGIGCASCGSIILSSIFGLGVSVSLFNWLPGRGLEFSWLGIIILLISICLLIRKINQPKLC